MMPNDKIKCTIKPSKIHGVGVFAIRDIKAGEKMFCKDLDDGWYYGLDGLSKEVKNIVIARWPIAVNGFPYKINDIRLISFMNHSDVPNYDKYSDTALVDIKAGDEVFENYDEYKEICLSIP